MQQQPVRHDQGSCSSFADCCSAVHAEASKLQASAFDDATGKRHCEMLHAAAQLATSAERPLPAAQLTQLVDALARFWAYGRQTVAPRAALPGTAGSSGRPGRYVPPSQRSSAVGSETSSGGAPHGTSDSSGAQASYKSAVAVRQAALSVLQELAKGDGSALHSLWDRLLPSAEPLNEAARPASLANVLLFDPAATVRGAAASAAQLVFSGKKTKAFMAIAESTVLQEGPARAFTTLSGSLATMLEHTHAALTAALRKERSREVQPELLRLAATFVSQAPFARLAPGILPSLVEAALAHWPQDVAMPGMQVCPAMQERCVACSPVYTCAIMPLQP